MQARLFYDDSKDACSSAITESGKSPKQVAADMRPDLKAESAKTWVHNCIDPDKADKFSIEHLIQFINLTKRADGTNALMDYLCDETGQERTKAKAPEDERAALQRAFIQSVHDQQKILEQFEKVNNR